MARRRRHAMTLMELMLATAMMSTVLTAVAVLVRTSYSAWQAHEQDLAPVESAHAVVRHILRQVRQADSVLAISAAGNDAGSLSLQMSDGETVVWSRNGANDTVLYGVDTATDLLAQDITALRFRGLQADATTATTDPSEVRLVEITAVVELPRPTPVTRTITCTGWIRTW